MRTNLVSNLMVSTVDWVFVGNSLNLRYEMPGMCKTTAKYHRYGENNGFTGVIVSIPSKSVWKSIDLNRAL